MVYGMTSLPIKNLRHFSLPDWAIFAALVFCSVVDLPGGFRLGGAGGISGLGAGTFAIAGLAWCVFLVRPVLSTQLLRSVLFLILFEVYAAGTMLWSHTGMDGIQLLVVGITFLGLLLVSARETFLHLENGMMYLRGLVFSSCIAVGLYLYVVYTLPKLGADEAVVGMVNPRPFALYALTAVGVALGLWRGATGTRMNVVLPLIWAAVTTFTVALSMSRTALVCCALLFPLAMLLSLNFRGVLMSVGTLAAGAVLFVLAVLSYKPLYDRFFAYDASMSVGGVSVNASGRTKIWELLYRTVGDDWIFGKGMAASELIIRQTFNGFIAQPHNDYLRYYYDTGAVGLTLYLCFALSFFIKTFGNLRRSVQRQTPDYPLHAAALLAFSAVSWSMLTDNPVCYSFVMLPLAIVMGCSLGAGAAMAPVARDVEPFVFNPVSRPLIRGARLS
jgi:O-antigen ligase